MGDGMREVDELGLPVDRRNFTREDYVAHENRRARKNKLALIAGHTKGPWKVQRREIAQFQERAFQIWTDEGVLNDRPIAYVDGDNAVWLGEGEDVANAYLIAAAPDLYKACQEVVGAALMGDVKRQGEALELARKAVAKALPPPPPNSK